MEFLKGLDPRLRALVVVLLTLIAGGTATFTVQLIDSDGNGTPDNVTFTVNAQPGDGAATKTLEVPAPAVDQAARQLADHDHLRAPSPLAPPGVNDAAGRAAERAGARDGLVEGGASSTQPGCKTAFVRNQSSRNGVRPNAIDMHYTVGPNRPGPSDVDGYTAMANNPGTGVSWHYVIDREGNCRYNVPEDRKAWTQAAHNPWAIGIEVVNTGGEGSYMDPAGYRKLATVVKGISQRWGIPIRRGSAPGCVTRLSGILQHKDLGLCGGAHMDITPFSIDQVIAILRDEIGGVTASPLTKVERRIARGACKPKGTGHSAFYWRSRARAHARRLDRLHDRGRAWKVKRSGVRRKALARAGVGRCS